MAAVLHDRFGPVLGNGRGRPAATGELRRERALTLTGTLAQALTDPSWEATAKLAAAIEADPSLAHDPDLVAPGPDLGETLVNRVRCAVVEEAFPAIRAAQMALEVPADSELELYIYRSRRELAAIVEDGADDVARRLRDHALFLRQEAFAHTCAAWLYGRQEPEQRLHTFRERCPSANARQLITSPAATADLFAEFARLTHYLAVDGGLEDRDEVLTVLADKGTALLLGTLGEPDFWALPRRSADR